MNQNAPAGRHTPPEAIDVLDTGHDHPHPHEDHAHDDADHKGHEHPHGDHSHDHPHTHENHGHEHSHHDSGHADRGYKGHDHGDHDHHDHDHDHDHDHGTGPWAKLKHMLVPHSHDSNEAIQSAEESSKQGIRAAWIGLAGMGATAIMQMVIVAISGSIALLADTLHNVGHAVTTIPLVIAFRIGQRVASKRYSYGYRRAEDLVGLFISLIIAVSAAIIIWESVDALLNPRELTNLWWVFAAGLVGAAGNELVAMYRIRTGKRIGSAALIAEGQHARADGLTSVAVVIGVIGVWLGFARADAIIGFFIAAAILWILVSSLRTTLRRLMDGVDDGTIDKITSTIRSVPGVASVTRVRARWSGHRLEADANIGVDSGLTVLEAHAVAEEVEHAVLHSVAHTEGVVVHLNPVVGGAEPPELHELTAHHASSEARAAYRAAKGLDRA
ncbi:cation diffusion facilitator family transporter [Occultella glacieicola]|uniref:Cation diffusion facilitator family transporter n=1 Tax=Occultella glacieicola TaxID=2518684 RepID=A0ABY2DX50_9MICO|nr:cation diffusion facilitator family transporter [Occultella glacieicola]TDE88545.1 cation diffusion facilitator family transporter [Occultella glacieicola]